MDCPVTPIGETSGHAAARLLLAHLERGEKLDASRLRQAMESAFKAPDATGAWDWKMAYDAAEAASVLFLRRYGPALMARASGDADLLTSIARLASLLLSQTRRSDDSQTWQQFSTPLPLAFCLMRAVTLAIPGARPHPTKLVQSAAMASVRPPGPSHKPTLPDAVIHDGLLSDAQLESVIYAGQAHDRFLAGRWKASE